MRLRLLAPLLLAAGCAAAPPPAKIPEPVEIAAPARTPPADEHDPATHLARLADPRARDQALQQLGQLFEDAVSRDAGDRRGPSVAPLLDTIVPPLAALCAAADVAPADRARIVWLLAAARDPRGSACLVQILVDFRPGTETEVGARDAIRAVRTMKLAAASGALIDAFDRLQVSRLKAVPELYRDLHDAMIELRDPAWEPRLLAHLAHPIVDRRNIPTLRDEVFWQVTAAELLGLLRSPRAVRPLLEVVLSPPKIDIGATAVNALIKIGKESVGPALALLASKDAELVAYSRAEIARARAAGEETPAPESAHAATAAIILAAIGREEAAAPLVAALDKAGKDDVLRAIIARELPKLPVTDERQRAFQRAVEKTPAGTTIPPGGGAREALIDTATQFFDPRLVPWLVQQALSFKGKPDDVDAVRDASLAAALKLMTAAQIPVVEKLFKARTSDPPGSTVGTAYAKEWAVAVELARSCQDHAACYLARAVAPSGPAESRVFESLKATYMATALGGAAIRPKLVAAIPSFFYPITRFAAAMAIDHLSPAGDTAIAADLQRIVDEGDLAKDPSRIAANAPLRQVIYRLRARAE